MFSKRVCPSPPHCRRNSCGPADFEATLPRALLYMRRRLLMMPMPINPMRFQMARNRNYTGAPINYYQAVCHSHETINSVAPVHRRADKLSRSVARDFTRSPARPPSTPIASSNIFSFTNIAALFNGRSFNENFPGRAEHLSCRQDFDNDHDLFVLTIWVLLS